MHEVQGAPVPDVVRTYAEDDKDLRLGVQKKTKEALENTKKEVCGRKEAPRGDGFAKGSFLMMKKQRCRLR